MKRVLLLLAVLLFSAGSGTMMAQQDKAAEKAAKKAEKEARKAAEEAENMALFEQAVQALNDKDFVLEADRVEFKRGRFVYVTPSTNNKTIDSNAKMEKFEEHDSVGIGMAISAMSVVFCGLILLYISFKIIGKISVNLSKRNAMKAKGITDKQEAKEKQLGQAPGEVFAAISMAMHEFQSDVHDVEDTILTITRVKRSYSPWSSKIYTLRETPHKK